MGDMCLLSLAGTHLPDPFQLHLYCSLFGRDDREGNRGSVLLWGSLVSGVKGVGEIDPNRRTGLGTSGRRRQQ